MAQQGNGADRKGAGNFLVRIFSRRLILIVMRTLATAAKD